MLIAGLGLGMILWPILNKKEVESVVVIEQSCDVINLVSPTLPKTKKLSIEQDDIFTWKSKNGTKFNVIYFDIWHDICVDNLDEMAKLHRRFGRYLDAKDPKNWMGSWKREWLRYQKSIYR